jgi:serine protease AprX
MSAPFVSGTAALLLSIHRQWSPDQVMERITRTARPLVNVSPLEVGKLGDGMLDAAAALAPDLLPASSEPPANAGDEHFVPRRP